MEPREDNSDSGDEEEILVFADFRDILDKELKQNGNLKYVNIVGIESESPVIQLNNYFFKGEYEKCLGTHLFFETDPEPPKMDPVFVVVPKIPLRYVCKTRKVLNMKRIFLTPRDGTVKEANLQSVYPELESHGSSTEEALDKFESYIKEHDDEPVANIKKKPAVINKVLGKKRRVTTEKPTLDDDVE